MKKRLHPLFNEEGAIGAESTSVESTEVAAVQTQEAPTEATEDVTKQESFAKRLKESTDKAIAEERTKWEQESNSKVQQARDALIAENGYTWNGKAITTEAEYKQALREKEIAERFAERDLPEDVLQQLIDGAKFREQVEPELAQIKQERQQAKDFKEFHKAYPDTKAEEIPKTVWDEYAAGKNLVDSYAKHENAALKQRLSALEQQKQIEQQNIENAALSTGSVVGQGSAIVANFTREQVAAMSKEDMKKNYSAVVASMKTWKK